ncbi:hypothetical protein KHP57_11325 [Algiphilus sp. NNCM1]|uniref:anti-sigma factor family protein n=1 Tax=Algiphilus sp. TaxID=1872431 RepID=UPI001CA6256D|nr:hypothetical protein [Algiphilus sp.]MBY8966293.1 hypothetical protein [Algiphilus acroporae]MCI5102246.1 hypothetical protein [Algiphilus sp.]
MSPHEDGSDATRGASVQERDLMALADGRIAPDSEHAARIREYLQADPNAAARFASWQQQNAAIRAHYAPALAEPVPERLQPETLRARRHQAQGRRRRLAVAAAGAAVVVAAVMRLAAAPWGNEDAALDRFAGAVAKLPANADTAAMPSPVSTSTLAARHEHALPDLGAMGYALKGQRSVHAGDRTATEARYEDAQGRALRLFVTEEGDGQPPQLHRRVENGRQVAYWRVGQRLYALASQTQLQPGRLQRIAGATRVDRGFGQAPSGTAFAADQGRDVQPPPQGAPLVTMEEAPARSETAPARPASVHYEGMVKDSSL